MKYKCMLLFALQLLLVTSSFATPKAITNIVVFGDSFSDRGNTEYGGFNRYSNGRVWPEYLAKQVCRTCLQDYAWGGAKTDYSNYNGFNWSGVLWQIEKYQQNTNPDQTLYIIWAGINDLINGDADGAKRASNIIIAIQKLVALGAKNIAVFTLPDFTLVPAYSNSKLTEYGKFSPLKDNVKSQITAFNTQLQQLITAKQKSYQNIHQNVNLYLVDYSSFLNDLVSAKKYKNTSDPWRGTYLYPEQYGYLWWDAWHPMTSVHALIAARALAEFKKVDMIFVDSY